MFFCVCFVNRALDSFQREFNAITNACNEQEKELRLLQNLMHEQVNRSDIISSHEDAILQELNALELDAYNFGEESHFVSNMCSSVMSEIESMSNVKLISVPFKVDVDWDNTKCSQISGRYPQINNLRLAYRSNENAGLKRDEINSAWAQAAQLLMFACQVNNFTSPNIRLIPLSHPCAKISDRQIMNNLGWDAASISGRNRSIPMGSLVSFLTLLNQLSAHNISKGIPDTPPLPYLMTDFSIDSIDLTKLAESDVAAWSSVIFCIASNLRWLSKLP